MKITVAGVGYVGLSLAVLLAQKHDVTAITTTESKAEMLNNFISPIPDDEIERFFKENGIDQWQNGYPNLESTIKDIENGHSFVICDEDKVIATAAIIDDVDPNYAYIEDGEWLSNFDYVCVHRVATLPDYKG